MVWSDARARVVRGGEQVYDGYVSSLKRHERDVREVRSGFECGIGLEDFQAFQDGDVIEIYVKERQKTA